MSPPKQPPSCLRPRRGREPAGDGWSRRAPAFSFPGSAL